MTNFSLNLLTAGGVDLFRGGSSENMDSSDCGGSSAPCSPAMGMNSSPPPTNHFQHYGNPMSFLAQHMSQQQHHAMQQHAGSPSSPPPIPLSDPGSTECRLIDYRGAKVAAFVINGETMLCLPQAFELFLKHLVGGLHTVYTKLKRLDITPLVCNVEQVRILRGLGAIQPGVNRCKLLCCKDFDVLYKDCTTASSRPGRPPKRASIMGPTTPSPASMAALGMPNFHAAAAAAAAAAAGLPGFPTAHDYLRMRKAKLENGDFSFENGPSPDKSPLLGNGFAQPPNPLNAMHMMGLSPAHAAAAAAMNSGVHGPHGGPHPGILMTPGGFPVPVSSHALTPRPDRLYQPHPRLPDASPLGSDRHSMEQVQAQRDVQSQHSAAVPTNGLSPVLNLSKSNVSALLGAGAVGRNHSGDVGRGVDSGSDPGGDTENEQASAPEDEEFSELDEDDRSNAGKSSGMDRSNGHQRQEKDDLPSRSSVGTGAASGITPEQIYSTLLGSMSVASSTETLLRNIEGLLRVAADSARQQERQVNLERAELKMELAREREHRESAERQYGEEQKIRSTMQRRLRRERRIRKRTQDQLETESAKRKRVEEAMRATAPDVLRSIQESLERDFPSKPKQPMNLNVKDDANNGNNQSNNNKRPSSRDSTSSMGQQQPHDSSDVDVDAKNLSRRSNNSGGDNLDAGRDRSAGAPVMPNPKVERASPLSNVAIPLTTAPDARAYYQSSVLFNGAA